MRQINVVVILISGLLMLSSVLFAGTATVFFGTVRSIHGADMVLMLKDRGGEKRIKLDDKTKVFASGKVVPYKRIMKNSLVEVAVNSEGKCLQVVVQEGPK